MALDRTFFRSKVARRMVMVFLLCALLPITTLAVISLRQVSGQLYDQGQRRLHQASKSVGMAIYERLLFLESELRLVAIALKGDTGRSFSRAFVESTQEMRQRFVGVTRVTQAGQRSMIVGEPSDLPVLSPKEWEHLRSGRTLLAFLKQSPSSVRIFIGYPVDAPQLRHGVLLGEIDEQYLWGTGEETILPPDTDLCVMVPGVEKLFCSIPDEQMLSRGLMPSMATSASTALVSEPQGSDYLSASWSLPVRFRFFSPDWKVVLMEAKADVYAPIMHFKQTFSLIALLTLCIVVLLSVRHIRKSLTPLQRLREGTRRIAQREFGESVAVSSRDEFEELAQSFNAMGAQLARQFKALATMAEIDRAILSVPDARHIVETLLLRLPEIVTCDWVSIILIEQERDTAHVYLKAANIQSAVLTGVVSLPADIRSKLATAGGHMMTLGPEAPVCFAPLAAQGMTSSRVLSICRQEDLLGFVALGYRVMASDSGDPEQLRQVVDQAAVALSNARDIADRSRAEQSLQESNRQLQDALIELKATQRQVIQQERLRALGQMASGIAHDFNNVLSPILGYTELLLQKVEGLGNQTEAADYLRTIQTAAHDAARLVRRLREFHRPSEVTEFSNAVHLNDLVEQSIRLTQPKWKDEARARGATIHIETCLQEIPRFSGNEVELREALINLILNAVDAMPSSGTIRLSTEVLRSEVVLRLSDTGMGMSEEVRQRCFEPFFTTKGEGGTGLGLSMVYGIIQRHQGRIAVESESGRGTTFTITFPVSPVRQVASPRTEPLAPTCSLRILVVDDDPRVGKTVADCLRTDGHTVELVGHPREALRQCTIGRFDLVLTDQSMPDISGDQLASLLKKVMPKLPIILLSGLAPTRETKPREIDVVLQKPVTVGSLREAVVEALGVRPPY